MGIKKEIKDMNIFRELGIRDGKDRINEEVVYNVARAFTIIESHITEILSPYNLSIAKFNIMLMVKHVGQEKGLSQHEISKYLLVTTSNITRMLDKIEKDGYIERCAKKGDRRVNLIRITKKGSDLLDYVWPYYKKLVDGLIGSKFNDKDKNQLNRMLERFKDFKKA